MAFNFKNLAAPLVDLLYPPLCLHCQAVLSARGPLLCTLCLEQLELVETAERCRTCFSPFYKGGCERCIHRPVVIRRQLAACEAIGPASTLLRAFFQGKEEVIPGMASLMGYQWLKHKMLLPDLLIPLPGHAKMGGKEGKKMLRSLAQEVGKIFDLPVMCSLRQKWDYRHFLQEGEFRNCFRVGKGEPLCDVRILLIAPVFDDALLREAGEQLKLLFPAEISALGFA